MVPHTQNKPPTKIGCCSSCSAKLFPLETETRGQMLAIKPPMRGYTKTIIWRPKQLERGFPGVPWPHRKHLCSIGKAHPTVELVRAKHGVVHHRKLLKTHHTHSPSIGDVLCTGSRLDGDQEQGFSAVIIVMHGCVEKAVKNKAKVMQKTLTPTGRKASARTRMNCQLSRASLGPLSNLF